jgi:hypothetical protein
MSLEHGELLRLLHYDPETGFWSRRIQVHGGKPPGEVFQPVHNAGYVHICIGQKKYLGHRLAVFYMTGEWPKDKVDHEDTNRANNKWTNIRPCSQRQNRRNSRISKANKTGLKGVYFNKKERKFEAQIKLQKSTYLGRFDCPAAAHFAYLIAADLHFGVFARAR